MIICCFLCGVDALAWHREILFIGFYNGQHYIFGLKFLQRYNKKQNPSEEGQASDLHHISIPYFSCFLLRALFTSFSLTYHMACCINILWAQSSHIGVASKLTLKTVSVKSPHILQGFIYNHSFLKTIQHQYPSHLKGRYHNIYLQSLLIVFQVLV